MVLFRPTGTTIEMCRAPRSVGASGQDKCLNGVRRSAIQRMLISMFQRSTLLLLGLVCFLFPLKFTRPVVILQKVYWPQTWGEWFFEVWPNELILLILILLLPMALFGWREWPSWKWLIWPVLFLIWQVCSAFSSMDPQVSFHVLLQFSGIFLAWLTGYIFIRDRRSVSFLLVAFLAGTFLVLLSGVNQATGGLEELGRYLQQHPEMIEANPGLWEKTQSSRIFATFTSPNSFGGFCGIAIFVVCAWMVGTGHSRLQRIITMGFGGALLVGLAYCLWRTGSKGSFLAVFLSFAISIYMVSGFTKKGILSMLAACFAFGLIAFFLYGRPAFEKGLRTSEARFGYWRAAMKITAEHPVFGSGPGTFGRAYPEHMRLEDEPTRLVHNDYLQIICDSGIPAGVFYFAWFPMGLWLLSRRWKDGGADVYRERLVLVACMVMAIHSCVDYDLYVPGISWPVFLLFGYLCRR
jgi:O-antigen ligase